MKDNTNLIIYNNLLNEFKELKNFSLEISNKIKKDNFLLWNNIIKKSLEKIFFKINKIIKIFELNYQKSLTKFINIDEKFYDLLKKLTKEIYNIFKLNPKNKKFNLLNFNDIYKIVDYLIKNKKFKYECEIIKNFNCLNCFLINFYFNISSILSILEYKENKLILWKKSLSFLMTINEYLQLKERFQKFRKKINNKNDEKLINSFFNRLLNLFWMRFCVETREYIELVLNIIFKNNFKLINKIKYYKKDEILNKDKKCLNFWNIKGFGIPKYINIWNIIFESDFLKNIFLGTNIGTYKVFSFVVHDYSFDFFETRKSSKLISDEIKEIIYTLNKCNFAKIKNEIESIYNDFLYMNNDYFTIDIPNFDSTLNLNKISDILNFNNVNFDNILDFKKTFLNFNNEFNINNMGIFSFLNFYNIFDFLDHIYRGMYGKDENNNKW